MEYRESVTDDWQVYATEGTGSELPWDKTQITVNMVMTEQDAATLARMGRGKDGVPMTDTQKADWAAREEGTKTWDNLPDGGGDADDNEARARWSFDSLFSSPLMS